MKFLCTVGYTNRISMIETQRKNRRRICELFNNVHQLCIMIKTYFLSDNFVCEIHKSTETKNIPTAYLISGNGFSLFAFRLAGQTLFN